MSEESFQVGDTVQLRSGGPNLKVVAVNPEIPKITVEWPDDLGNPSQADFLPSSFIRCLLMYEKFEG